MKFNPRLLQNTQVPNCSNLRSLHSPPHVPADWIAGFNLRKTSILALWSRQPSSLWFLFYSQHTCSNWGGLMAWISRVPGCPMFSAQVPRSVLWPCCCRLPAQRFHSQHSPSAPSFASGPKVGPLSDVPNCPPSQRSTLLALLLAPSPQHSPRKAHSQRWNMDVSVWWYFCCCSCSFSPGFSVVDFPTYHSPSWLSWQSLLGQFRTASLGLQLSTTKSLLLTSSVSGMNLPGSTVSCPRRLKKEYGSYTFYIGIWYYVCVCIYIYKMELDLIWIPYPSFPCKNININFGINFSGWTALICWLCIMFHLHKSLKECIL